MAETARQNSVKASSDSNVTPLIRRTNIFCAQFQAILVKNLQTQRKNRSSNCHRCCLVFLCSFFSVVFMFWLGMLGKK